MEPSLTDKSAESEKPKPDIHAELDNSFHTRR